MAKREPTVYGVYCDGIFDQVCYSLEEAMKEKADLKKMGFSVSIKLAADDKSGQRKGYYA